MSVHTVTSDLVRAGGRSMSEPSAVAFPTTSTLGAPRSFPLSFTITHNCPPLSPLHVAPCPPCRRQRHTGMPDTAGKKAVRQNGRLRTTTPPARPPDERRPAATAAPPGGRVATSAPRGARIGELPQGTKGTPAAVAPGARLQMRVPAARRRAAQPVHAPFKGHAAQPGYPPRGRGPQRGCPPRGGAPPSQSARRSEGTPPS